MGTHSLSCVWTCNDGVHVKGVIGMHVIIRLSADPPSLDLCGRSVTTLNNIYISKQKINNKQCDQTCLIGNLLSLILYLLIWLLPTCLCPLWLFSTIRSYRNMIFSYYIIYMWPFSILSFYAKFQEIL